MTDYTSWHVGMKVVCVADDWEQVGGPERLPIKGEVYTIRSIAPGPDGIYVMLVEIVNEPMHYRQGLCEMDFHADAFRPVQRRVTDISIFTAMLNKQTEPA